MKHSTKSREAGRPIPGFALAHGCLISRVDQLAGVEKGYHDERVSCYTSEEERWSSLFRFNDEYAAI